MKKVVGGKSRLPAGNDLNQQMQALESKQLLIGAALNMSWRMAITVIIPVVGGVKLDSRFNSSPSWTLVGLMLAAVGASVAVWSTVKEVNQLQEQSKSDKESDDS